VNRIHPPPFPFLNTDAAYYEVPLNQTRWSAVKNQVIRDFPQPFRTINGIVTQTGPKPQPLTIFGILYSQMVLPFSFIISVISTCNNVK
jgi:hypothetical protein